MIVQYYKSQVMVGNNLYPIPPGGASLNWNKNHSIPFIAGNFWQINYIEGFQAPTVSAQIVLLDGTTANCPIHPATLNSHFMTRSNDYQHDVSAITNGLKFFDGFSGYTFANAKANSWTISGSKGDDLRFSATYMIYDSTNGGANIPVLLTAPPDNTYPYFQGNPIRFQALSFQKKASGDLTALQAGSGNDLDGLVSFSLSFSNNMNPDMSMKGNSGGTYPYQYPLPIDCNASMMTASAQFTFQANSNEHIQIGDAINIRVRQGSIATQFGARVAVVETAPNRQVGAGRQMRVYNCTLVGTNNTAPPILITAS